MPSEVLDAVLALAVASLLDLFENRRTRRFRVCVVSVHVVDKYREEGGRGPAGLQHDDGATEVQLRTADRVAISVVLAKAEGGGEPRDGLREIRILKMRQNCVRGRRPIPHHGTITMGARQNAIFCAAGSSTL